MTKPKEFWISNNNPLDICSDAHVYDNKPVWFDKDVDTHVIEKAAFDKQVDDILTYCKPHIDKMWAASIVGILLDCDFKDAHNALKELGELNG